MTVKHDTGVCDEPGGGGGSIPIDTSGKFSHLSPKERRATKNRRTQRQARWRLAKDVRARWSEADYAAEEERLAAQIAEWERNRDAT